MCFRCVFMLPVVFSNGFIALGGRFVAFFEVS